MRSRNNLTPYSIYFGSPNTSNYGALLGPSYKKAKTEYGLRSAKMFLARLQELAPNTMLRRGHIDGIIDAGDELFERTAQKNEEANMKSLKKFVRRCLRVHDVEVNSDEEYQYDEEKEVSADDDSGSNAEDESTESDEIPTAATFAAEAATATDIAGATSNAPAGSGLTTTYDPLEPFDWKNIGTTAAVNVAAPTYAQGTATVPTAKKSAKTASKVPTAQPSGTTTANPDIGESTLKPAAQPSGTTTANPDIRESTKKPAAQPSGTTMAGPGNQDGDESGKDN